MQQRAAKIPPQTRVRLAEAAQRVVQLCEAIDKKDDAAKWRKVYVELLTEALLRDYAWLLLWGRPVR